MVFGAFGVNTKIRYHDFVLFLILYFNYSLKKQKNQVLLDQPLIPLNEKILHATIHSLYLNMAYGPVV